MRFALGILLLLPTLSTAQTGPKLQPRPHEAPAVKLLEPGKGPLAPLRYALKGPQRITITATGSMDVVNGDTTKQFPFPALTLPVILTPGKATVDYVWLKPTFTTSPGDTQTTHIMAALEGSKGQLRLADGARGVITTIFVQPSSKDPMTEGQMQVRSLAAMELGKGVLGILDLPFPDEPIGVGGRWQVSRVAQRGAVSFRMFQTFTLLARRPDGVDVSYRFGGEWEPGSGFRAEEVKVGASGGGTCTVRFDLPMPTALDDQIEIKVTMTAMDGTQTFQTTRVGSRVESK